MPYEVRHVDGGCEVVNKNTGEVKAKHSECANAERQVRLLHAIENDPNFKPKEG